jgi:4-methylaminobutanoate oxidase (formaldehyde-forming)
VPVTCARITYLGELGYELYVAAERALELYDALAAGEGVRPVGLKALASLRMEKAYRDYGHDIDNTDCPLDVGLGFAVAWDTDFRGKAALEKRRADFPSTQRLVQVRLTDPDPLMYHAEPVLRDGRVVGYVRAASYGWTLGAAVGLAFVTAEEKVTKDWLDAGTWEVDIAGERYAAEVSLRPMYDPTSARVRA